MFPGLTVKENIMLGASEPPGRDKRSYRAKPMRCSTCFRTSAQFCRQARLDAVRRPVADGRGGARADGQAAACCCWTSRRWASRR